MPDLDAAQSIQFEDIMDDEEQYFMSQINQLSGESAKASQSLLQAQSPLEAELAQYWKDTISNRVRPSVDVLGLWSEHQQVFPLLAKAAK